jgi:hypothetical protein
MYAHIAPSVQIIAASRFRLPHRPASLGDYLEPRKVSCSPHSSDNRTEGEELAFQHQTSQRGRFQWLSVTVGHLSSTDTSITTPDFSGDGGLPSKFLQRRRQRSRLLTTSRIGRGTAAMSFRFAHVGLQIRTHTAVEATTRDHRGSVRSGRSTVILQTSGRWLGPLTGGRQVLTRPPTGRIW